MLSAYIRLLAEYFFTEYFRKLAHLILLVKNLQPVGVGEPARAVAVAIRAPRAAGPAVASLLLHGIRLLSPQLNLHCNIHVNNSMAEKYLIFERASRSFN